MQTADLSCVLSCEVIKGVCTAYSLAFEFKGAHTNHGWSYLQFLQNFKKISKKNEDIVEIKEFGYDYFKNLVQSRSIPSEVR